MPINIVPVEDTAHLEPLGGCVTDLATLTGQYDRQAAPPAHLPGHSRVSGAVARRRQSSVFPIPPIALSPGSAPYFYLFVEDCRTRELHENYESLLKRSSLTRSEYCSSRARGPVRKQSPAPRDLDSLNSRQGR
jgi:hypothetical protein